MSSAFDTIDRSELLRTLRNILPPSEITIIAYLLSDTCLKIRYGDKLSDNFPTNIGVPQGDSLSPVLFNVFLENALKTARKNLPADTIELTYADDNDFVTKGEDIDLAKLKEDLRSDGLQMNESKTEITTKANWKNTQKLGTYLGTEKDLERRKHLALLAMNKLNNIWRSNKVGNGRKIRLFQCYVQSVLLYNCATWGACKTFYGKVDKFQRKLLRRALSRYWPDVLKNVEADALLRPASLEITKRRREMLGHVARGESVAGLILEEVLDVKRGPGRPPSSLVNTIRGDLKTMQTNLESVKTMSREEYKLISNR